jgi:hypothetical protein
MAQEFDVGDRVITPGGTGKVAYWRFGFPDFSEVVAYGVILDSKKGEYGYSGTTYSYKEVKAEEKKP